MCVFCCSTALPPSLLLCFLFLFPHFCQHFSISSPPRHYCFCFSFHCQSSYFLIVLASLSILACCLNVLLFCLFSVFSYSPFAFLCCLLHTFLLPLSFLLPGIGEHVVCLITSSHRLIFFLSICLYVYFFCFLPIAQLFYCNTNLLLKLCNYGC